MAKAKHCNDRKYEESNAQEVGALRPCGKHSDPRNWRHDQRDAEEGDESDVEHRKWLCVTPNVGAEPTVEAGADWPRRDDDNDGPERPGGACRSGSARASC